jgi:hypothetical protein
MVMVVVTSNRMHSLTTSPNVLQALETAVGHGLFVKLKVQNLLVLASNMFVRLARTVR